MYISFFVSFQETVTRTLLLPQPQPPWHLACLGCFLCISSKRSQDQESVPTIPVERRKKILQNKFIPEKKLFFRVTISIKIALSFATCLCFSHTGAEKGGIIIISHNYDYYYYYYFRTETCQTWPSVSMLKRMSFFELCLRHVLSGFGEHPRTRAVSHRVWPLA